MKDLTLKYQERLGLVNFLCGMRGLDLARMQSLGRVLDAVRFSDEEAERIKPTPLGNGMVSYPPAPTGDFGNIAVQIDNSDAEILTAAINNYTDFTVGDRIWSATVKTQLAAPSTKKKGAH